ncbi:beta-glucanase [Kitasatospora sp. NBC_01250]|uniref:beta-glucanase n=1 Tax=unclassified Kitasatospora TaxID=2633591 RepID=UPI002E164552|nr:MULTISPECIES: beta-glucanase [unclassified Kitasatospora]WSJ67598.1 beta-glucanase [Kitasatospora sp. NBC_01302]
MAVVFDADFTSPEQWVAGRTSAYPNMGPTNQGDHKLDRLVPAYCPGGVFTATRGFFSRLWNCNLLTTEGSPGGFQLRSGDLLTARVVLPTGTGAWPAIWTWRDGDNEVDVFEYHPDHPDLLEFSNHLAGTNSYWHGSSDGVAPGATVQVSTRFGADSVDWYVGDTLCFADGAGVGTDWSAYLIVNLSVSDGTYHPAPSFWGPRRLSWTCQSLQVER